MFYTPRFFAFFLLVVLSVSASAKEAVAPEQLVKALYSDHQKNEKSPFFQSQNRKLVDKYFTAELGDLLWKDAVASAGEIGALSFDPLFYSQDPQVTELKVGEATFPDGPEAAIVPVTFKNSGEARRVQFELSAGGEEAWKINRIIYHDGENLGSLLRAGLEPVPAGD